MSMIDHPGTKRVLWENMRADLVSLVPSFSENELILCPACCRPLPFSAFTLEHILPQQAVRNDPKEVRESISTNERSGLTLLCNSNLYIKGTQLTTLGCNSWKGRHYDRWLRETIHRGHVGNFHVGHHIALLAASYLGMFQAFGYACSLTRAGLLLRRQFFSPRHWLKDMPLMCQMVLMGEPAKILNDDMRAYWSEPFKFAMNENTMNVVVRSLSLNLPVSRDPTVALARYLPYAPPRHKLKPDLTSLFD